MPVLKKSKDSNELHVNIHTPDLPSEKMTCRDGEEHHFDFLRQEAHDELGGVDGFDWVVLFDVFYCRKCLTHLSLEKHRIEKSMMLAQQLKSAEFGNDHGNGPAN